MIMVNNIMDSVLGLCERELTYVTRGKRLAKQRIGALNAMLDCMYEGRYRIIGDPEMIELFGQTRALLALEIETLEMMEDEGQSIVRFGEQLVKATEGLVGGNDDGQET